MSEPNTTYKVLRKVFDPQDGTFNITPDTAYEVLRAVYSVSEEALKVSFVGGIPNPILPAYENILFVGQNSEIYTPTKGDITKPYKTLSTARDAATTGDTIVVMGGSYNTGTINLHKEGVKWQFIAAPIITGGYFSDENTETDIKVYGNASFSSTHHLLDIQHENTTVDFRAKNLQTTSSGISLHLKNGSGIIRVEEDIEDDNTGYSLYLTGNATYKIYAREIQSNLVHQWNYTIKESTTHSGEVEVYADVINYSGVSSEWTDCAVYCDTEANGKLTINGDIKTPNGVGGVWTRGADLIINGNIISKAWTYVGYTNNSRQNKVIINGDQINTESRANTMYVNCPHDIEINGDIIGVTDDLISYYTQTVESQIRFNGRMINNKEKDANPTNGIGIKGTNPEGNILIDNVSLYLKDDTGISINGESQEAEIKVIHSFSSNVDMNDIINVLDPQNINGRVQIHSLIK